MEIFERDIARALEEGVVAPSPEVVQGGFDSVLAVDRWRRWGAAFTLRVRDDGQWFSDIHLFQRGDDRRWHSMSSGGSHGADWQEPWKPEIDSESLLRPGQLQGQDVEDIDGTEIALVARAGFAARPVHAALVRYDGETHKVEVFPALNAFVVLGPEGEWSLTAVGEDGTPLAPSAIVECRMTK